MISQVGKSVTAMENGVYAEDVRMEMSNTGFVRLTLIVTAKTFKDRMRHAFFMTLAFFRLKTYDPHNDTACLLGYNGEKMELTRPFVTYSGRGFTVVYTTTQKVGEETLPQVVGTSMSDEKREKINQDFDRPDRVEFVFGVRTAEKLRENWEFRMRVRQVRGT